MRSFLSGYNHSLLLIILCFLGATGANAQYCSATYSVQCSSYNMYIRSFSTTGGITNITNNNTYCSNTSTSYTYYSGMVHEGAPLSSVNFSVTIGSSYPQGVVIWVDWNQDGDFNDAGEKVYNPSSTISAGGTRTGSFTIPVTASIGNTRMRVRSSYATTSVPQCGNQSYGECEDYNFTVVSNCAAPASINIGAVNSGSVQFNWSAVTGSLGYDYAVTTSQNGPSSGSGSTNNTSALVTGLSPNTTYFVHVRNNCAGYPSQWTTSAPFTTLPPCSEPSGFAVTYVDSSSADFTWTPLSTAVEYQYFIDQDRATPTSAQGANSTTSNYVSTTGLTEGNTYYVHMRSLCIGNDSSGWSLDSFYVPIACRSAIVMFNDLTTSRAVAYWAPANTAIEYEYAITETSALPPVGSKTVALSKLLPYLDDKTTYYFHTKSYCDDHDIKTSSSWATFSFKTIGVDVNNIDISDKQIFLYPNPVREQMIVNITGRPNNNGVIHILDVTGKLLMTENITTDRITIDVSNLSAGMYIVQYSDDTHRKQVKFNKR
ncbi:MAG: T9SS type A sorting domain-containing protein [Chitinophagales bacterium]|nr:T9SS type A sorting domain-containing protein [Chitinophagales bacterium]